MLTTLSVLEIGLNIENIESIDCIKQLHILKPKVTSPM